MLPLSVKIERVPPNPHEMEQEAFEEEDAEWRVHHWGNDGTITPVLHAGKDVPNKVMRLTCQAGDLESVEFTRDVRMLSLLVFNGMLNATLYMDNFTWDHVKKKRKRSRSKARVMRKAS